MPTREATHSTAGTRRPRRTGRQTVMTVHALEHGQVEALRASATHFGGENAPRKSAALAACAGGAITDPDVLVAYHDCLLFLLAYPESRALRDAARAELRRVAGAARTIAEQGPVRMRTRLAGKGIAWSEVTINFGWDIARWLALRFPRHGEIDSFDEHGVPLQQILQAALPPMEFELVAADDLDADAFLERVSEGRRGTRLAWLVRHFERLPCSDTLREQLFDALKAYVTIRPMGSMLSRTFVRGLPGRTFFHRSDLLRSADLPAILAAPLPPERRLSQRDRLHVVDAGRAMLAALGRETDAIALADPDGVAYHDTGRGVAIAIYTMRPGRRSPLDSHVGMMIFKNGLPVGYGGGWPFLGTCKIGVNIFAPYRGGESAFLFCQVLRVYRHRFGVERFVAEPSQFGGGNKEGLQSGAFWFYYRLGFRPVDRHSAALAHDEYTRMQSEPGYRMPIPALRRFTRSDIELRPGSSDWYGDAAKDCDPADLSLAVTAWIRDRFGGDRAAAEDAAMRIALHALGVKGLDRWTESERQAFRALAVLVAQIPDLDRWPATDKRGLIALMRAKGGDEFRFFALLQQHRRLRSALETLAARASACLYPRCCA